MYVFLGVNSGLKSAILALALLLVIGPMVQVVIISGNTSVLIIVSKYRRGGSKLQLATGSKWCAIDLLKGNAILYRQRNVTE